MVDFEIYFKLDFKYISDNQYGSIINEDTEKEEFLEFYENKINGKRWIKPGAKVPNGCLKEMARIFLKIIDIRIEKLQDISDEDILKEGVLLPKKFKQTNMWSKRQQLGSEWIKFWDTNSLKGYRWEDNPYVFVYIFEKLTNEELKKIKELK